MSAFPAKRFILAVFHGKKRKSAEEGAPLRLDSS
jgi:hypothetical protein